MFTVFYMQINNIVQFSTSVLTDITNFLLIYTFIYHNNNNIAIFNGLYEILHNGLLNFSRKLQFRIEYQNQCI